MKSLFKIVFSAFMLSGIFIICCIILGLINELMLKWYGPVILIPRSYMDVFLTIVGYSARIMFLTGPTLLVNILMRNWSGMDRKENRWMIFAIAFLSLVMVILPILLLCIQQQYESAAWWGGTVMASIVFANLTKHAPIPFADGLPWHKKALA